VWFVYVARCRDGSLYTGVARDVAARLAQHDAGKGARYTRGRGPLELCAQAAFRTQSNALRVELAVKALSRAAKEALVRAERGLARFARRVVAKRTRSRSDNRARSGAAERTRPRPTTPSLEATDGPNRADGAGRPPPRMAPP
jgi:putative endonuclease